MGIVIPKGQQPFLGKYKNHSIKINRFFVGHQSFFPGFLIIGHQKTVIFPLQLKIGALLFFWPKKKTGNTNDHSRQ